MSSTPSDTSIVLSAFTSGTMTVEKLVYNTMLTKVRVSNALQELETQGKVEVAGGAWTLLSLKKKGSTNVTTSPTKKAPAKKVAAKKVATPAKSVQAKKETSVKAAAKKVTPAKKAPAKKTAAKKPTIAKPVVKKNAVAAANGAKKHVKVAERDDKVLSIIVAAKKTGITDEEIATSLGSSLSVAYQSIRRLKDEGKINSAKGDNGVTRRFAA